MPKKPPQLSVAPPPEHSEDDERQQKLVAAVRVQFAVFPRETMGWILEQARSNMTLADARLIVVEPMKTRLLKTVPEPKPPTEREQRRSALVAGMAEVIKGQMPAGTKVTIAPIDLEAIRRESFMRGGSEVELDARIQEKRGPRRAILGVRLAPPHDTGAEMPKTVLDTVSWQWHVFTVLAEEAGLTEEQINDELLLTTLPVYFWHGTGLLDPEELLPAKGRALTGLFRESPESEKEKARREKSNRGVLKNQQRKDRLRREAAARREKLLGDPMVTPAQLDSLYQPMEIERRWHGFLIQYESLRVWELPAKKLIEELPLECLGIALFGWSPDDRGETLRQCAWKLRRLGPVRRRACLVPLRALAAVWLPLAEVDRILRPARG